MRPLRNLNPRYEADSWLPAGTTLNATTQIVGLYNRYCIQGPRATLAEQLVRSDPNTAIVRTGPVDAAAGRHGNADRDGCNAACRPPSATGRPPPAKSGRQQLQRAAR